MNFATKKRRELTKKLAFALCSIFTIYMEISKTCNPKFDNLLRLLSSIDEPNVRLGLQLARNFATEIEEHFGYSYQDLEALFEFLMQYEAWNFVGAFWEIKRLYLANRSVKTFPQCVGLLTKLTYLHLSNNQLQTLPAEIGKLQMLEELDLSNNQLQTLPAKIGKLKKLNKLSVNNNLLETLPAEIGSLVKLRELYIENNRLKTLPENIGLLGNLTTLHASQNQLQTLPKEMEHCTEIRALDLSKNEFAYFPPQILKMQHLADLSLGYNKISALPAELSNSCGEIQYLLLERNLLKKLPAGISNLPLFHLNLSHNPLKRLPLELYIFDASEAKIYVAGTPKDMFIPKRLEDSGLLTYKEVNSKNLPYV